MPNSKLQPATDCRTRPNLSLVTGKEKAYSMPVTRRGIESYVEYLLKPSQQVACDMATD